MNDSGTGAQSQGKLRFRDPGMRSVAGAALVICPRCSKAARAQGGRVICAACGYTRSGQGTGQGDLFHTAWQPRCQKCGSALPKIARRLANGAQRTIRLRCAVCQHLGSYPVRLAPAVSQEDHDPASGLPYYLICAVGRNRLWARNLDHLELLETYIKAPIRERPLSPAGMTMLARLPDWIKAAKNRTELLRAIRRLRASAGALL